MNQFVVVSLFCDRGDEHGEKNRALREALTGSTTNPIYYMRDPFTDAALGKFDYNQATKSDLAERIDRARRRFEIGFKKSAGGK